MYRWIKKWFLDGWITTGPQLGVAPGEVRVFARCKDCQRVWPHWWSNVTDSEFRSQKRKVLGCPCGSIGLRAAIIPGYQAFWWVVVRGWLIRKVLHKERLWDPRIPMTGIIS